MRLHHSTYAATRRFSQLVLDHLAGDAFLEQFQRYAPTLEGLRAAAAERRFPAEHRRTLVKALRHQYTGIDISGAVEANVDLLEHPDTLTVTTGHQLCLFTGPLYVPFKLLNVVRLARTLSEEVGKPVVPVFWMATEDHDRAEIDHAWLNGTKVEWKGAASGAVGRLKLEGIVPVLEQVAASLGNGSQALDILALLQRCYRPEHTLAEATRLFAHALFGGTGLVIVDGDDRSLKQLFVPVMREELLNSVVERSVGFANERLKVRYTAQAHARPINLFHLRPGHRSRIERDGDHYQVLDGGPRFTLDELLLDLELRPQDYSPNVLLRPLYQETILPNVAYVGGGGELAYWMQLKWLFQAVQVPMPAVLLRTSAGFLSNKHDRLRTRMGLAVDDLYRPAHELMDLVAHRVSGTETDLSSTGADLDALFSRLKELASAVDPTLAASTEAAAVRTRRMLSNLQDKMDRALRKREAVHLARVRSILEELFPGGGLQERKANVLPILAAEGPSVLERWLEALDPLEHRFTLFID